LSHLFGRGNEKTLTILDNVNKRRHQKFMGLKVLPSPEIACIHRVVEDSNYESFF